MKRLVALAAMALAGCQQQREAPAPATSETAAPAAPAASSTPAPATPPSPSTSRIPANVLVGWATAVTLRDWGTVRAYWGNQGGDSGLTPAQFGEKWDVLKAPRVEIGDGQQEGAAGSLFYTAPVTITDGARTITGEIVMRRVNDVDGASAEQLRWHIESSTLTP
ncbi:MAG TPA: hypothetical protein VHG29_05570 [Novosphingobium sp.]|nr:hypothetical protein [Novosphingobium sp.]